MVQDIQALHTEVAYEKRKEVSPFVVDHFLQAMTDIARYSTSVAQALCDAGIITTISATRDGWYSYPEAEDYLDADVRRTVQKNLSSDMLEALSERMYIAAHVQQLNNPTDVLTGNYTRPAVRRRPSWMATGG